MAGGSITRITGGTFATELSGGMKIYTNNFDMIAGNQNRLGGKRGTVKDKPKKPHVGTYFKRGWWTDSKDKPIKEAQIGETIRFHVQTKDIPDGNEVTFTIYDWDGMLNTDDKVELIVSGTTIESNKIKIYGNKGYVEWITGPGTQKMIEDEGDDEIELYVECLYKGEKVEMPIFSDDYLILFEKEVKITVLIELPHSKYSMFKKGQFLSSLGLAGHSAMAIGERYFDYGPDYTQTIVSEKKYNYDFNNDGDKNDNVDLTELDKNGKKIYSMGPEFAPGRPWWGEMISARTGLKPTQVKLNHVLNFIKLDWKKDRTNIYGEVHKVEFFVKESESKKMLAWWEERYKHLKVYSVYPWTGEQCTTAVKLSIQEAFPPILSFKGKNITAVATQRPGGLLMDLENFVSTSKKKSNILAIKSIIKTEATDFDPAKS